MEKTNKHASMIFLVEENKKFHIYTGKGLNPLQ